MTLKVMYVMEKGAKVDGIKPILPYQFAAEEKTGENFKCIVNIVMPLGGSESGLFRYPKKGEKILVGVEGNGSFLMGYLPEDTADNINTGTNHKSVMPDEMAGQFFRYKGPGDDKDKKDKYSEIGFYHEETKWKKKDAKVNDPAPKIDTLRITSEGDINQKARNHNQIKAKRFELLVDCDGSKKTDKESEAEFAFGDKGGDDTELYAGDAHIRAKSRVIIKAEDEIRLEVGRSSIIINDTGINIVSRKIRSNFSNSYDTTLNLTAADGVFMYAKEVNVKAGLALSLSEGFGGSVSSEFGVVRINGLDIRLATMTTANYSMKAAMNAANSFTSGLFMGLGMMDAGREGNNYAGLGSFGQTASNAVLGGGRALIDLVTDTKLDNFDIKDLPHILILTWDITCLILKIVGITLETTIPKKILRENPFARDGLYSSMWLIENGLAIGTVTALAVASFKGAIHESVIWLNSNAKITMDSFDYSQKTVAKMDANTAFAGVSAGVAKGVIKEGWKKVLKIVAGVTGGVLGAGAAAGATTAFFTGTVKANEQFEKELRSL
jgi:hypothetical protein